MWSKNGDRNTKLFHHTTISRRRRNKIVCIKNGEGEWIEGGKKVRNKIYIFYRDLFKSQKVVQGMGQIVDEVLGCIPGEISRETNQENTGPTTPEEVKRAVFQMGGVASFGTRRLLRVLLPKELERNWSRHRYFLNDFL